MDRPSAKQLATLSSLIECLIQQYQITHLAGHRDFHPDEPCPGRYLYAQLPDLAEQLGLVWGTGGYVAPSYK